MDQIKSVIGMPQAQAPATAQPRPTLLADGQSFADAMRLADAPPAKAAAAGEPSPATATWLANITVGE